MKTFCMSYGIFHVDTKLVVRVHQIICTFQHLHKNSVRVNESIIKLLNSGYNHEAVATGYREMTICSNDQKHTPITDSKLLSIDFPFLQHYLHVYSYKF